MRLGRFTPSMCLEHMFNISAQSELEIQSFWPSNAGVSTCYFCIYGRAIQMPSRLKAWPRPLWFDRKRENPHPRSKLWLSPSLARPSPNQSGSALSLAEGQTFGQSANSGGWLVIGFKPQPQTLSPLCQQDRKPNCQCLLGAPDSPFAPSSVINDQHSFVGRQQALGIGSISGRK